MPDLGGSDELSLIRYYGNGSYIRYGSMGFEGCTPMANYPDRTHLDSPADPTYYSLGELDIAVDIVRVPTDARGWFEDDGTRETMTMDEALQLLNTHIATYYERLSQGNLNMRFHSGVEFTLEGDTSPSGVERQHLRAAGLLDCREDNTEPCFFGALGGINRLLLTDVTSDTGGFAWNGSAQIGLVSLRNANMEKIVHEIGHAWMLWPHSFTEIRWRPYRHSQVDEPNPYSNPLDFMSAFDPFNPLPGWGYLPATMAINRYAAGWIPPEQVALHLAANATKKLSQNWRGLREGRGLRFG